MAVLPSYQMKPSNLSIHQQLSLISTILSSSFYWACATCPMLFIWKTGGFGGPETIVGHEGRLGSSRNWRRHPPVTFYSLTLADYRQLMHNKYTPLRVHYHLINISLWRERAGWGWVEEKGFCVTDVFLRLRGTACKLKTEQKSCIISSHLPFSPPAFIYTHKLPGFNSSFVKICLRVARKDWAVFPALFSPCGHEEESSW